MKQPHVSLLIIKQKHLDFLWLLVYAGQPNINQLSVIMAEKTRVDFDYQFRDNCLTIEADVESDSPVKIHGESLDVDGPTEPGDVRIIACWLVDDADEMYAKLNPAGLFFWQDKTNIYISLVDDIADAARQQAKNKNA